jgi:hypothetical protein
VRSQLQRYEIREVLGANFEQKLMDVGVSSVQRTSRVIREGTGHGDYLVQQLIVGGKR